MRRRSKLCAGQWGTPAASTCESAPEASGLVLVRSTFLSISVSHISLMVQPAPRMTRAPSANLESIRTSGKCPAGATSAILQQHGHKSSHVPMGLSARARSRYGWYCLGMASTHVCSRGAGRATSRPLGTGIRASRGAANSGPLLLHRGLHHNLCCACSTTNADASAILLESLRSR